MSASSIVPIPVSGKSKEELARKIAKLQGVLGGKVKIISIYFDTATKEHVCWYLPLTYAGGGGSL